MKYSITYYFLIIYLDTIKYKYLDRNLKINIFVLEIVER